MFRDFKLFNLIFIITEIYNTMKPILQLKFREVKQFAQKIILLEGILFWEELKKKKRLIGRKIARLCKTHK